MSQTGTWSVVEPAASSRVGELYRTHLPPAIALAYLLTGNPAVAEDLAQEAFLRAASRFPRLRDPNSFRAYLRRTVINLWKNSVRRERREQTYLARQHPQLLEDEPVDLATRYAVRVALLRLSPRQRAAIVLRYYEDLPERQIAELLECRPGTVKSLLARGVDSLRRDLGELEVD
jgi:RNA polymerase sigma-70 factor (sigma-E family)